jgi:hypothetical protein
MGMQQDSLVDVHQWYCELRAESQNQGLVKLYFNDNRILKALSVGDLILQWA